MYQKCFRNGTAISQVELLFCCVACYHLPIEKEGSTVELEEFIRMYYVATEDVKILVISLLKESQPQSEPPVTHSGTADTE